MFNWTLLSKDKTVRIFAPGEDRCSLAMCVSCRTKAVARAGYDVAKTRRHQGRHQEELLFLAAAGVGLRGSTRRDRS